MFKILFCLLFLVLSSCTKDKSENPTQPTQNTKPIVGKWKFAPSDTQSLEFNFTNSDSLYITMAIPGDIDSIKGVYSTSSDTLRYLGYFSAMEQFSFIFKYLIINTALSLQPCDSATIDFMAICYEELLLPYAPPNQVIFNKQ